MTKVILLSGANPDGLSIIIDDDDYDRVSNFRWWALRPKKSLTVYARTKIDGKTVYLHRMVMDCPPGCEIDHIDGNGLNCTRENLRAVSHAENVWRGNSRRAFDAWEHML